MHYEEIDGFYYILLGDPKCGYRAFASVEAKEIAEPVIAHARQEGLESELDLNAKIDIESREERRLNSIICKHERRVRLVEADE